MTKQEYAEKWSDECMKCEWLKIHRYRFDERDPKGNYTVCFWSKGVMDYMPDETSCKDMAKVMVMNANNIWEDCPMYVERIVELLNLDEEDENEKVS